MIKTYVFRHGSKDELVNFFYSKHKKQATFINKYNFNLTEREKEVLTLITKGKNNLQIANELCVSVHTAKAHVAKILQKLDVDDRVQAAIKAISENLVQK